MTVVLWGRADEAVVAAVAAAATALGVDVLAADGTDIVSVDIDGELLTSDGSRVELEDVSGILVRPEATPDIAVYASLSAWTEFTAAAVFNPLPAGGSNRSKPYQLGFISTAGFAVPDTLVTTDPNDVRAFQAEHGQVIYKSTSGVRSIVSLLQDESRLEHVSTCPTQFQQFVPGVDYRVHVVGDELFACRIESSAIDYRYASWAGQSTQVRPATLPDGVAQKCRSLCAALGLGLAGIDLRQDADGRWWCFEVNTSPGFVWFEQLTGQPITNAVARALV